MNIKVDINVCRVCLKSDNGINIFSDKILLGKFQYATLLNITKDDGLPTIFCDRCIARLKIAYDFRRLSIISDTHMRAFINKVNSEFKQVAISTSNSIKDLYNVKDEDIDLLLKENYKSSPDVIQHNNDNEIEHQQKPQQHHTIITPQTTTTTVTIIENSIIENNSIIESANIQQLTTIPIQHHQQQHQSISESEEFTKYIQEDEIGDTNYIEDSQDDGDVHEEIEDDHENENEEEEEDEAEEYDNQIIKHQEILLMTNDGIHNNIHEITMSNVQFNDVKEELNHQYEQEQNMNKSDIGEKNHQKRILTSTSMKNIVKNDNRIHLCIKCDKDFSTKTNLMRHMLTHDGVKPYQCKICGNGFTQNGSLKSHMLIHTGERPHRCEVCGRGFTQSKSLTFHMRRHTGEKPFTCFTCGLNFRQKDGLKRHIQIKHSGMPSESHQCTICNRILHSKYSLALHMRKHLYRDNQQQNQSKQNIDNNIEQQSNKKLFKCEQCNKEFSRKTNLSVHKKIHEEKQLKIHDNNNNSNRNDFETGKLRHVPQGRKALQHLRMRNNNKETLVDLFKCDTCSIAFNTKRGLKLHLYNEHKESISDLNECDICNIPFVSVDDLNQHIINIHDNINEKCGICLENFTSKKLYEDHILEHEIEQEYTIT